MIPEFLKEKNTETLAAVAGLLSNLDIKDANDQMAKIYRETKETKVKTAFLLALNALNYTEISALIRSGMEDVESAVRVAALGLLNNNNVTKDDLSAITNAVFSKGSVSEQQQLLSVMGKLDKVKTLPLLENLVAKMTNKTLSPNLGLELQEAVEATGSEALKQQLTAFKKDNSLMSEYADALFGGNRGEGRNLFLYNSTAQCARCHVVNGEGGNVGPELSNIGNILTREQILQAMIEPSARLAPNFGNVTLKFKDGQEVTGILAKETDEVLTLKTSDAEPLVVPISRIAKRENLLSSMPVYTGVLSKREMRDIVEYLTGLKKRN
jgi:putative heme-binding domain-containing protein